MHFWRSGNQNIQDSDNRVTASDFQRSKTTCPDCRETRYCGNRRFLCWKLRKKSIQGYWLFAHWLRLCHSFEKFELAPHQAKSPTDYSKKSSSRLGIYGFRWLRDIWLKTVWTSSLSGRGEFQRIKIGNFLGFWLVVPCILLARTKAFWTACQRDTEPD